MKALEVALPVALAIALLVVGVAPIGPLPGVFIGGHATAAPGEWADTSDVDEIRLKVPGVIPRVVIIWVVEYGGELHVVGSKGSGWVKRIGDGSPVEMRLGENTYSLTASPVTEGLPQILEAYVAKYQDEYPDIVAGFPSVDEGAEHFGVFQLRRS